MKKLCLILALALLTVTAGAQQLRLAHAFSDHAVFQRETTAPVWGWAAPGATVSVTPSWNGKAVKAKAGSDGRWRVEVATGAAGGPYTLKVVSGKETLVLQDILLGEVWICCGQSNMEMPLGGFGFQEVEGAREAILSAASWADKVRVLDIRTPKKSEPVDDIAEVWTLPGLQVATRTSAVAWFFATRLTENLGVPVGIIVNPWGGSRIEPWMSLEAIHSAGISPEELQQLLAIEEKPDRWPETPELIWNGRMLPVAGYAARGFLWYQGCSNIGQKGYDKLQAAMVRLWRETWGRGDMPFIYALLAPYEHGDADGRWRPHFVETQLQAEHLVPASWAVCTETLGNKVTVHPAQKKEVADLMALRALQNVYGLPLGFDIELPRPASYDYQDDGRVRVTLSHVWSNLQSMSAREVVGFELAGEDRVFHLAQAEVDWDGGTLWVRSDEVPHPVAVRYGFRNWMGANLQTSLGIPVPPFRSDDWEY